MHLCIVNIKFNNVIFDLFWTVLGFVKMNRNKQSQNKLCCFLFCLSRKPDLTDSASLLETFKFLENAAAEFSDEDDDDDIEGRERTIMDTSTVG